MIKGYVYIIQLDRWFKIGASKEPKSRLYEVGIKMPVSPKIIAQKHTFGYFQQEKKYHHLFKDKRLDGEWFALTKMDLDWLINEEGFSKLCEVKEDQFMNDLKRLELQVIERFYKFNKDEIIEKEVKRRLEVEKDKEITRLEEKIKNQEYRYDEVYLDVIEQIKKNLGFLKAMKKNYGIS